MVGPVTPLISSLSATGAQLFEHGWINCDPHPGNVRGPASPSARRRCAPGAARARGLWAKCISDASFSQPAIPGTTPRDEACPVSTEGGTRRVRLVREGGGRGVSATVLIRYTHNGADRCHVPGDGRRDQVQQPGRAPRLGHGAWRPNSYNRANKNRVHEAPVPAGGRAHGDAGAPAHGAARGVVRRFSTTATTPRCCRATRSRSPPHPLPY